jgi:very-short-patch-repair endonuclease
VLEAHGLPRPVVNGRYAGGYIPDFRWPEARLILEADSRAFHGDALARADDAERQAFLEVQGDLVLRTTWREATLRPEVLAARVRAERECRLSAAVPTNGDTREVV